MRSRALRPVTAAVVLLAAVACSDTTVDPDPTATAPTGAVGGSHPQILEERVVNNVGVTRLADGVVPPTNRWYSSLALGEGGMSVYPRPLSFTPVAGGFSMGLTSPVASENAIIAAATHDVTVMIDGASDLGTVTSADSVAVSLAIGGATVTMAQGWPAVGIAATEAVTAQLSVPFEAEGGGVGSATVNGQAYGIVVDGGAIDGSALALEAGGSASLFAVPDGTSVADFASALGAQSPTVTVSSRLEDDAATTSVSYGDASTVVVLPAARAQSIGLDCTLGTFATIDGSYAACGAREISWDVPRIAPSSALDLEGIGDDERAAIVTALRDEASAGFTDIPGDSYFGSKGMYRLANLVQVADAMGETDIADQFATRLAKELTRWAQSDGCATRADKCLVYDPEMRGVVGLATSFGSEDFNDHYFHYGYLIYAAAVAGARDAALLAEIAPAVDLLADDIASPVTTELFPQWRAFDPVAGHSWASGVSPFADGNNQESSSEAVAAWNGVALWRTLRGEDEAAAVAEWMLAAEAEAARRLYLEPDVSAFPAFGHGTMGIEWGSKRDFATWFSAEPNAIIGIQLIPSPPAALEYYAAVAPERVASALAEAQGEGAGVQFADYLLMYAATQSSADAADAWDQALALGEDGIDDGNSRPYLLAWIAAQKSAS